MKSFSTLLISFFFPLLLLAQEGSSLKIRKPPSTSVTRAVIIGISNYEDDGIPDLRFAHKDAEAFARYLISPAGGSIPQDNVQTYLNEKATGGNIHKALYWLVKESKKGDHCIIYFSGHGDVETIYEDEPGHFLAYDSPSSIYQINSLRIDDLKRIVATLSNQKEALVTVITDACRSGKLAGSEVNGAQATAAALSNQFANERKIMSCQANEYSVEGEQWGEGRGIFSYHLIEGLTGLADNDANSEITLKEIQRYLEDRFDEDLVDSKQTPVTVGDRISVLAVVDEVSLSTLRESKMDPSELMASADTGNGLLGLKTGPGENLESKFYEAINKKQLLNVDLTDTTGLRSAEYYYQSISSDPKLAAKHQILKGDFIAALQDDAQVAINKYLSLDQEEMNKRWFGEHGYDKYARYLSKAVSLIDESHFFYPQIKAKEIYFSVVSERITLEREEAASELYDPLIDQLNEALRFQSRSSFINNELGLLYLQQKKYKEAIAQWNLAIEISPTWALLYTNKSLSNIYLENYTEAEKQAKLALTHNPNFTAAFLLLSYLSEVSNDFDKAISYAKSALSINPNHCQLLNNLGYYYYVKEQDDLALLNLNKAISCQPHFQNAFINKYKVYLRKNDFEMTVKVMKEAEAEGGISAFIYNRIARQKQQLEQYDEAELYFNKALTLNPKHYTILDLGRMYLSKGEIEKAKSQFKHYLEKVSKTDMDAHFDLACASALQKDLDGFTAHMQKAIELGYNDKKEMEESKYLSSIRDSDVYKEMLQLLIEK